MVRSVTWNMIGLELIFVNFDWTRLTNADCGARLHRKVKKLCYFLNSKLRLCRRLAPTFYGMNSNQEPSNDEIYECPDHGAATPFVSKYTKVYNHFSHFALTSMKFLLNHCPFHIFPGVQNLLQALKFQRAECPVFKAYLNDP